MRACAARKWPVGGGGGRCGVGEAVVVAPFKYTNMIWAILFGFVIWGDLPDAWTMTGATIVIVGGLYIIRRESRRHTPAGRAPVVKP